MKIIKFVVLAGVLVTLILFMAACTCTKSKSCQTACSKTRTEVGKTVELLQDQTEIDTTALKSLIDSGAAITVLDARSAQYDDGRRIPGAKSLQKGASEEEAASVISTKDDTVITYCANLKCPASKALATRLKELGYKKVIEYPYGIDGWVEAGNKYESVKK